MKHLQTLRTTLVQTDIIWQDPVANLKHLDKKMAALKREESDLIILPEMFPTGFTVNAEECAEPRKGMAFQWMKEKASEYNAAVTGSIIVNDDGQFYNRLYFVYPDGDYKTYDKRHAFSYAGEHKIFTTGEKQLLVKYRGWTICPMICYDLRFPVWSRNTQDYDLIFYIASWPESRIEAWDALLKARAIENMSYCVGVNRIGTDGNDIVYTGHSAAFDALGRLISPLLDEENDGLITVSLHKTHLQGCRDKFRFLQDRDSFELK